MTVSLEEVEPPVRAKEPSQREAEVLRRNIELFVDGVMDEEYSLAELLNESFSLEMLDLLFKRMTSKLRAILFSRAKSAELVRIAMDASLSRHTRLLATSFLVVGSSASCLVPCPPEDHSCSPYWETIFNAMQREAQGTMGAMASSATASLPSGDEKENAASSENGRGSLAGHGDDGHGGKLSVGAWSPSSSGNGNGHGSVTAGSESDETAAVAEMEALKELIQVEVKDIEQDGERSRERSFVEQQVIQAAAAASTHEDEMERSGAVSEADDDDEDEDEAADAYGDEQETAMASEGATRKPTLSRYSTTRTAADESCMSVLNTPSSPSSPSSSVELMGDDDPVASGMVGIYSADTANFSSQILRYFALRGQKGSCILQYIAAHPPLVDLLLKNIGHDDTRTLLLHLIYSDHSEVAMDALFTSRLLGKMIDRLVLAGPPRNAFERDSIENTFLLLREVVHAPYLTTRGVAISAKTIPLDKVTGQDEYVSICGASREQANSARRKYTSRKVRRVVQLFMTQNQLRLEQLFTQMIKELTFWSSPHIPEARARRGSISSANAIGSLSLLHEGHPRPSCTTMLMHLFELTETVDFAEEEQHAAATRAALTSSQSATSAGIDCLNFMCSTHLVRSGTLQILKKLRNEVQQCELSANCMMGLRITSLRTDDANESVNNAVAKNDKTSASKATMASQKAVVSGKHSVGANTTGVVTALEGSFVHSQGNQITITLDELESVERDDWHPYGFTITAIKPKHTAAAAVAGAAPAAAQRRYAPTQDASRSSSKTGGETVRTVEYLAASSEKERDDWLALLRAILNGDLPALEVFCSDDWRSNIRIYRRLRECLVTSMERKGHEVMVFLRHVVIQNTRQASGYHLWTIVKFLHAVIANESKRLDQMFASAQLLDVLLACYEQYPSLTLVLGEITSIVMFCLGDFKSKRSRRCPIIEKLLLSEAPEETTTLLKLLTRAFVDTDGGRQSPYAATDTLANLKLVMTSVRECYLEPTSRSQERIQARLKEDPQWQRLLLAVEEEYTKHPTQCITAAASELPTPDANTSPAVAMAWSHNAAAKNGNVAPSQPAFQDQIISHVTRPCYFTAHGFGSSFLLGNGCAFGYMFKERQGGAKWQKVLLVYEYVSYKLWYFYPSEVDETHDIKWKWIVPVGVRGRYTHGHDETHSSIGHHGLYVTVYDDHHGGLTGLTNGSSSPSRHVEQAVHGTRELHFSVTKLEDRDRWKKVLQEAAATIQQLAKDYSTMSSKLKKPDKKTVTHCQEPTCRQQFKLYRRPHSCKRCGRWFCGKCSQQRMSIPEVGLMHPVRHCQTCFNVAGGNAAELEPLKLFRKSSTNSVGSGSRRTSADVSEHGSDGGSENLGSGRGGKKSVGTNDPDDGASFSNPELYELAHGLLSPRALLLLRRRMTRQDSIDSPRNLLRVDEMDDNVMGDASEGLGNRHFFGNDFQEGDDEVSPCVSPPYVSPRGVPSKLG